MPSVLLLYLFRKRTFGCKWLRFLQAECHPAKPTASKHRTKCKAFNSHTRTHTDTEPYYGPLGFCPGLPE